MKLTLSDIGNLASAPNTAESVINNNWDAIVTAMENTLSRDGTPPNTMSTDLDMNGQTILNLPEATEDTHPVRKAEFDEALLYLTTPSVDTITLTPDHIPYPEGGFWADLDAAEPTIWRFRDRVFIGDATETNANRITGASQPNWGSYANWMPRDSDLAVMSSRGALAISGLSRSSDAINHGGFQNSTWGIGGFVINDRAGATARGGYFECQFESGASYGYGCEIVMKNKGADVSSSPYTANTGTYGLYIVAGGDSVYGGSPAAPSNTAVYISTGNHIAANTNYRWNKGIVFDEYSLTGADGTGATDQRSGVAIEMAVGHNIRWSSENGTSGQILASGTTASKHVTQIFQDDSLIWYGASGHTIARLVHTNVGVNGISLNNATTANAPSVNAFSTTDTNVDLKLSGQGTGVLSFGTWTSNADAPIHGYVTIKDSSGNPIKLATIA
jgi:hypothetical protein